MSSDTTDPDLESVLIACIYKTNAIFFLSISQSKQHNQQNQNSASLMLNEHNDFMIIFSHWRPSIFMLLG